MYNFEPNRLYQRYSMRLAGARNNGRANERGKLRGSAVQMLIWAIEEIEKTGNKRAECLARQALKCLRPSDGKLSEPEVSPRVVQLRPGRTRIRDPDANK